MVQKYGEIRNNRFETQDQPLHEKLLEQPAPQTVEQPLLEKWLVDVCVRRKSNIEVIENKTKPE